MTNKGSRGRKHKQGRRPNPKRKSDFEVDRQSNNNEGESKESEFFYGKHLVLQFLEEKKPINKLFIQEGLSAPVVKDILDLVKQQGIVYQEVPKSKLDELSDGGNHQGLLITTPPIPYASLEDCFELASSRNEDPFFLILDGIEDPHNLGSIIRTADATGVHGIIIPKRRAVGLTGIVAKTSAGAIDRIPVVRVTNIAQTMDLLKEKGVWVFATAMEGQDMREWSSRGPIALIIGNEGEGVSSNVIAKSDGTINIPMTGNIQSLNASVAAAVLMYEVARHRLPIPSQN